MMTFAVRCVADEEHVMLQEQVPDRHAVAYLERQARSLRLESNRASPTPVALRASRKALRLQA